MENLKNVYEIGSGTGVIMHGEGISTSHVHPKAIPFNQVCKTKCNFKICVFPIKKKQNILI